jgi:hypothetical protein
MKNATITAMKIKSFIMTEEDSPVGSAAGNQKGEREH